MNSYAKAVLSALIAGMLSALMVAQSGASFKLIALAFGVQFLKDLESLFTPVPEGKRISGLQRTDV